MALQLAGDIGGTKTILRLVESTAANTAPGVQQSILYEQQYVSREFPDLVPMVQQFFQEAADKAGSQAKPQAACFAIAGPVVNNTSELTNLSWSLDANRLRSELEINKVELINDFAAIGYGVLGLESDDVHILQTGTPEPNSPIAIIGAGTGLGQGFLIEQQNTYYVYPSEGGHSDFAPRSEIEFQLLDYLLDRHQITRISAERVVSGQGIVAIYQFLRDRQQLSETPEIAQAIRTWEQEAGLQEKSVDPAAVISKAAVEQKDALCERTMNLFISAYGAEAGNLALKLLPYGGLYVAGGIAAKNLSLMKEDTFLSAFTHKGRVSHLLKRVPVYVVLNPKVGLIGAALCAARL
jgi:glucokinase